MSAPTRVGWAFGSNEGFATLPLSNPVGAATGDRIIALVSQTNNAQTITNLQGWTLLSELTYNTRRWHIIERDYAPSYTPLTLSATAGMLWVTMAIRADDGWTLEPTVLGATWRRVDNGGSINTTQAPSVNAPNNTLALALYSETSTGAETEASTALAGTGWAKWFWSKAAAGDANPVNYAAYKDITTAAASGVATTTWANNSNNGAGVQLLISQTAGAVTPPTGHIGPHGCFNFDTDYLVAGTCKLGGSVHEAVLYSAGGTTELDRITVSHDETTAWGSATFSGLASGTEYVVKWDVDGVPQTDAIIEARTLSTAPASFKFGAGSCQFTGSNHPVFDVMAAEGFAFLDHGGDLDYGDATDEPTWRAAKNASLNATRMKSMLEGLPMAYVYDNHDIIRTEPLGGGSALSATNWKHLAGATGWLSSDTLGRSWRNGRVLFVHPDLRTARDNYQTVAEPRTMMGATQLQAFKDLLTNAATDPDIALVVWFTSWTSVLWGSGRWGSYLTETADITAHIDAMPSLKAKIVQIAGDSHNLQADSGTRNYAEAAFKGIPSLNVSGFNRSSPALSGFSWDLGEESLRTEAEPEADWGAYSRVTIDDDGSTLTMLWEAVRVDPAGSTDVMSSFERSFGAAATGWTVIEWDGTTETVLTPVEWDGSTESVLSIEDLT